MIKKLLSIVALLTATLALAAAIPFSGPGVNCHGQMLPIASLRAVGVHWVRLDLPPAQMTQANIRQRVLYYRSAGLPQLWILPQMCQDPAGMARNLVHWGAQDIEAGNECDGPWFNAGNVAWTGAQYAKWFGLITGAVRGYARVYGPVSSTWNPQFTADAWNAGMRPAAIDFHGYAVPDIGATCDLIQKTYRLPGLCSEDGAPSGTNLATWWGSRSMQMGVRPWIWYDGPQTDWRGLFASTDGGGTFTVPTPVYQSILASLALTAHK